MDGKERFENLVNMVDTEVLDNDLIQLTVASALESYIKSSGETERSVREKLGGISQRELDEMLEGTYLFTTEELCYIGKLIGKKVQVSFEERV